MTSSLQRLAQSQNNEGEQFGLLSSSSSAQVNGTSATASDSIALLSSTSLDTLRTTLTDLNRTFQLQSFEERPDASDERIKSAIEFIANGGIGTVDITSEDHVSEMKITGLWSAWNTLDEQRNIGLLPLVLRLLANLLQILGTHQPNHEYAEKIVQCLLPISMSGLGQSNWYRLQAYLSEIEGQSALRNKSTGKGRAKDASSDELISSSLHLLLALTSFAGAKYARIVFDSMNWGMKSINKFFNMRRKNISARKRDSKRKTIVNVQSVATLAKPDIRTLWIMVLLSFLRSTSGGCTSTSLRIAALSMGKEIYPAMMKGLSDDPAQIVAFILMGLHDGLLSDEASSKLPRGKVVSLFNEWTCKSLVTMYDREGDSIRLAQTDEQHSISDIVHHFLLALCTHPGRGVCYSDNGWYGRRDESLADEGGQRNIVIGNDADSGSRLSIYNKILLGVLRSLAPYRCPKQGELALRILAASPELSGPYLGTLSNILDPKPASISWLSASTFFGRAMSLPLPQFKAKSGEWMASPPSRRMCMDALLPACITKTMLNRGISMQDRLSRFATITLLVRVLERLISFRRVCQAAGACSHVSPQKDPRELHLDSAESILRGQFGLQDNTLDPWMTRWGEIVSEAQERLPDISHLLSSITNIQNSLKNTSRDTVALEATLRACWLYLEIGSSFETISVSDVDKLFQVSLDQEGQSNREGLRSLARLHAMRAVAAHAQGGNGKADFDVFSKTSSSSSSSSEGSSNSSSLSKLLQISNNSALPMLRNTSTSLLAYAMKSSVLFEHDGEEWQAWEHALQGQDNDLFDFVDECAQRCMKTPYRYIEMARRALTESNKLAEEQDQRKDIMTSPLFHATLEQFVIRTRKGLLPTEHFSQSFLRFLNLFLIALCILGRPVTLLSNILDECKSAIEESEQSNKEIFFSLLATTKRAISAVIQPLGESRMDPILRHQSNGSINWESISTIDAKIKFLSLLANVIDGEGNLRLAASMCRALENGAKDKRFLQSHLFGNKDTIQRILKNSHALSVLVEVCSVGPFHKQNNEDLELLNDFIQELLNRRGEDQILSALSRLIEFVSAADQHALVNELAQRGINLDAVADIMASNRSVQVYDDDIARIICKTGKDITPVHILQLLPYSLTKANENSGALLIDFTLRNFSEPLACNVLRSLLARYPSQLAQVITAAKLRVEQDYLAEIMIACAEVCNRAAVFIPDETIQEAISICNSQIFAKDEIASTAAMQLLTIVSTKYSVDIYPKLVQIVPSKPIDVCKAHVLQFSLHAMQSHGQNENASKFVRLIVENTLLWLVRRFAEDDEDTLDTVKSVQAFVQILKIRTDILSTLSHLIEPVLTAAIERRLDNEIHAELISILLTSVIIRNLTLQQYFDKLLHHRSAMSIKSIRSNIISAITVCIERDSSIANVSLLKKLAELYGGSLERSDRQIFDTLINSDQKNKELLLPLLKDWNVSNDQAGFTDRNLIWRLNPDRVLDLIQHFPRFRTYIDLKSTGYLNGLKEGDQVLNSIYDPLFVLSVYGQFLSGDRDPSGLQLVQMMRTNALGAVACCLSSSDQSVRDVAAVLMAKTYRCAHLAQFQEKEQLLLVMDALRNSLQKAKSIDEGSFNVKTPLPLTITIFIAHAIRAIAQPSLYLYPLISRFLLQRAKPLDPTDVPLLYGFLYASSYQTQTHKQQRLFILRFLIASLRFGGEADWRIMRHRHVWQGVCMLYTSSKSNSDMALRRAIEEFWLTAMEKEHVISYAVLRAGFLEYGQQMLIMEKMNIMQSRTFWLTVLTNLLQNCDFQKLNKASNGAWLGSICGLLDLIEVEKLTNIPSNLTKKISGVVLKLCFHLTQVEQDFNVDEQLLIRITETLVENLLDSLKPLDHPKQIFEDTNVLEDAIDSDSIILVKEAWKTFSQIRPQMTSERLISKSAILKL